MTLLTSILGGGSSGGGGSAQIGEVKQILTANGLTGMQSNTITESGGSVWLRANAVYKQSSYPDLFARIGFVNAQIGLTKTLPITGLGSNIGYSPQDDLYVFSYGSSLALSNSSLTTFVYKSGMTSGFYSVAFGGDGGNARMVMVGPAGIAQFYPGNQTLIATNTTYPYRTGIISANGNTFLAWSGSGPGANIVISTNSGATFAPVNVTNSNVVTVWDIAYGNINTPNGMYIISPYYGHATRNWTEYSTDGIRWSGLHGPDYVNRLTKTFGLGTANIYLATFAEANASLNTYNSRAFTSTDGQYWEYRGLIPYSNTSQGTPNRSANRITAAGNGANTVIATTDYWFNSSHTTNYGHHGTGHHYFGCHHDWIDFHDGQHWSHFGCTHMEEHVYGVVSYHYTSAQNAYNRIYTANATVTNTPSLDLWGTYANTPGAHNNQGEVISFGYGYANNAAYYLYSTANGNLASSTDAYTWVDRGSVMAARSILYGTANSTNLFMLLGASGGIRTSQNLVSWATPTTAYSLDTGVAGGWGTGAFGNANGQLLYILGGNSGNVMISNDGIKFSGMNSLANAYSTAYGNNSFVAGMANGVIKYSKDGIYWSNTGTSNVSNDIIAIASDNVKFVYVGTGGKVGYVYDVTTGWTNATITTGASNDYYSIMYGGGLWLMGGKNGSMYKSTDGITWTYQSSNTNSAILSLMYANNTYVYGGDNVLATSTDAITWIKRTPDPNSNYVRISSLAYGNGYFVYGAQGYYGRSTDGITWSTSPIGSQLLYQNANGTPLANTTVANAQYFGQVSDIYYGANVTNTFISVGVNGFAATSPDGNVWTLSNTKTNADFYSLTYGNGRFLTVGTTGTAKISPDGVIWSGHASNANVFSIAYYQNTVNSFILVGAARTQNTQFGQMNANTTWVSSGLSNVNYTFVLETSNDGIYWSTKKWNTPSYPGFAVGGNVAGAIMEAPLLGANTPGHLVVVSNPSRNTSSRVSVSANLDVWSGVGLASAYGNTDYHLERTTSGTINVSFANGSFFATGANTGIVARSNDGIYWTHTNVLGQFANTSQYQPVIPGGGGFFFYKLVYHGASKTYILPHANNGMFVSKDLVTWTARPLMYPGANTHTNPLQVDGPLVLYVANTSAIQYTNSVNNFVSASYDTGSEFYVPGIIWNPGTQYYTYGGPSVGPNFGGPTVVQNQSFGQTPELIWYVRAKL